MKAKLHKLMGMAVLGLALCSQSLPALAGVAGSVEVFIQPGYTAQGSLTGARYSADSEQYIGCSSSDTQPFVQCFAWDNRGRYLYCLSNDARTADAVKGMTDSSRLYFSVTSRYYCADLTIDNDSKYLR